MQHTELNVTRKDNKLFTTLNFTVNAYSIADYLQTSFQEFLSRFEISRENITYIHFEKLKQNGKDTISVTIKYCNINLNELALMDDETKIKTVLKHMGYTDSDIKSILYQKYSSNSNELFWIASIRDKYYNDFQPDESYSAHNYYTSIHNAIHEVLGFVVKINFV